MAAQPDGQAGRRWPGWLPAALPLLAEAGHLAAATIEWPTAAWRGGFHVAAAAALGFVAAGVYFGPSRIERPLAGPGRVTESSNQHRLDNNSKTDVRFS